MKTKQVVYPALAGIMASRGETHQDLGDVLGLSSSAISRRMSGEVEWCISEVKKVCEYYGKSYYDLFDK